HVQFLGGNRAAMPVTYPVEKGVEMGYVEKNLMPSEEVVYKAKIHWSIYVRGIITVLIGAIIIMITLSAKGIIVLSKFNQNINIPHEMIIFLVKYWICPFIFGGIFIIFGLINLIKSFIFKISTELVVTTKRVIAKFGFVKRDTIELNHNKVESFMVQQSIIQRILNSGTIIIQGTGGGKTPIPNIDDPLEFRNNAMGIIDKN
ncbi:MAG: PH domain-containing protein, partial [Candidatus Scalinduaceae bacterium]